MQQILYNYFHFLCVHVWKSLLKMTWASCPNSRLIEMLRLLLSSNQIKNDLSISITLHCLVITDSSIGETPLTWTTIFTVFSITILKIRQLKTFSKKWCWLTFLQMLTYFYFRFLYNTFLFATGHRGFPWCFGDMDNHV